MKVMGLLRRVAREKRSAVIAVTHDHRMVDGFDSAYEMNDGRLAPAADLRSLNIGRAIPMSCTGDVTTQRISG